MADYTPPFWRDVENRLAGQEKTDDNHKRRKLSGRTKRFILMSVPVMALIVVGLSPSGDSGGASADNSSVSPTEATQKAPEPPVASCDGWEIDRDENVQNRVISGGLNGASEEAIDEAFEKARHDERILLYLWGYTPQGNKQAVEIGTLVTDDESCLSDEGIALWYQAKGAWDAASVSDGVAPAHACNTGMTEDGPVRASRCGISGDRSAAHVVFKDGTEVWVLYRCGNITTIEKPDLPEGPTDEGEDEDEPTSTTRPPRVEGTSTSTTSSTTTSSTSTTTTTFEDCSDCDPGPYPPPEEEPDDPEEVENPEEDEEEPPPPPPPPDEDEEDPDEELPR